MVTPDLQRLSNRTILGSVITILALLTMQIPRNLLRASK